MTTDNNELITESADDDIIINTSKDIFGRSDESQEEKKEVVFPEVLAETKIEPPESSQTEETSEKESDEVGDTEPSFGEETKLQHVSIEYSWSKPSGGKSTEKLALPSKGFKETEIVNNKLPNIDLESSKLGREWRETVSEGFDYASHDDFYNITLEGDGRDFRQFLQYGDGKIKSGHIKGSKPDGVDIKGEDELFYMLRHLKIGTRFATMLPHSGFWITFKTPPDSALVSLIDQLNRDKIIQGRRTYGLSFSNQSGIVLDRFISFALDYVYTTTISDVKPSDKKEIKKRILAQDIPILLWGFLNTIYPDGFDYRRGCINKPANCNYILEARLQLSRIFYIDNAALNDWQKSHMAEVEERSRKLETIIQYQDQLMRIQKKIVEIKLEDDKKISIHIKSPNVENYLAAANGWLSGIETLVMRTLGDDTSIETKNELIELQCQASVLKEYSHWIEKIEIDDNKITDSKMLEQFLEHLSRSEDVVPVIREKIQDYIRESTIAVIGVPVFDCPVCKKTQGSEDHPHHPNIIPLEVLHLFFNLLHQRIFRISNR